ncbi:MAG: biotin transporter BioY, partial [Candidatus Flemingiibacterium sp.]
VQVAMFAALTAVLTLISIPTPWGIPITLQTFAVSLCGYMLGAWQGLAAIGVYIAIGAVGLPVFSGLRGGVQVLTGATGGYIFGFLFLALLCGLGAKRKIYVSLPLGFAGLAICHLLGTLQFGYLTGRNFPEAFLVASAPYLIKDAASIVLAYFLALKLRRFMK